MSNRPRYRLDFRPEPGRAVPDAVRLRRLLKCLLRSFGFRAVSIEELSETVSPTMAKHDLSHVCPRLEAEHGGELVELSDPTPRQRAERLLASEPTLNYSDAQYVRAIADGDRDDDEPA